MSAVVVVGPSQSNAFDELAAVEDDSRLAGLFGIPVEEATLVATTELFALSPPSPDPTGITYIGGTDRLLVSDSEVDEVAIFANVNLFTLTRGGVSTDTGVTLPHTKEPAGVAYDAAIDRLYVADDSKAEILVFASGPDGRFGSDDDDVSTIDTACFGASDPEGIAVDPNSGDLYIAGGEGNTLFRVSAGPDGVFDGKDDVVWTFDLAPLGAVGPEGIAYNAESGTLLILDTSEIFELTRTGDLIRTISFDQADPRRPSGIVLAPATVGAGWNMFIVARGVDNNVDPLENDGYLYEMSLDFGPPDSPSIVPNPGSTVSACGPGGSFLDDDANVHESAIEAIAADEITVGCDLEGVVFCPERSVTRAQMASFLARALSLPPASMDYFIDDNGNTHEDNINRVAEAEITLGCVAAQFCPADDLTRAQMASFLARAFELAPASMDYFIDDNGNTHEDSINRVAEAEITLGCLTAQFCPTQDVTRAQMASFLVRALDLLLREPPIRPATTDGVALDAESALAACADPLDCTTARSIDSGDLFFLEEGSHLEGWSSASASERADFLDPSTGAEFRINGGDELVTVEAITVDQSDVAHKLYSFQFPDDLFGTLVVEVRWYELGAIVAEVVLVVSVGA